METPVVQLAQRLINIESISGKEQAMATYLQDYLTEAGWIVELQEVAAPLNQVKGETNTTVSSGPGKQPY